MAVDKSSIITCNALKTNGAVPRKQKYDKITCTVTMYSYRFLTCFQSYTHRVKSKLERGTGSQVLSLIESFRGNLQTIKSYSFLYGSPQCDNRKEPTLLIAPRINASI